MNGADNADSPISDSTHAFQWSLISYALHPERLFCLDNVKIWEDLQNQENFENYLEQTPEQLRDYFLQQVLPEIMNYDLVETEEFLLNLLALHPAYRRTENGFIKTYEMEQIDLYREIPSAGSANVNEFNNDNRLNIGNGSDLDVQVVFTTPEAIKRSDDFQMSKENETLLSVILCPNADLPACQYLSSQEMQKRLQEAQQKFQRNCLELDNAHCSIEQLLENLKTVCDLKDAISELVRQQL